MDEYRTFKEDQLKDNQYYRMNEEIQHDGRAFYTSRANFNRRDNYCKDFDLHEKPLCEEDGNEDNMAAPDVYQCGGNVNPSERRTCEASFKGLENSMCAPSSRGGGGANMQCSGKATG
jgi:hypothetical protein